MVGFGVFGAPRLPEVPNHLKQLILGVQKPDPIRFKWGFVGEGLLKDKFAFQKAYKSPTPKRRKLLAKRQLL